MVNNVVLVGRITKDPEMRYLSNGAASVSFSLAVDRNYTSQSGERQADFINCVAWRSQAEFMTRYIKKGYMMSVVGRIQTRQYQDQQGQTRYVTEVVCEQVSSLQPRDPNSQPAQSVQGGYQQNNSYSQNNNYNQGYNNQSYQPKPRPQAVEPENQALDLNIADDDLPF